jgi:hypothetical protein
VASVSTDVFNYLKRKPLPATVYIIGSGPCGTAALGKVPADACTVALNSAILHKRLFSHWMAFDVGMLRYAWWNSIEIPEETINVFGITLVDAMKGTAPLLSERIVPSYSFRFRPLVNMQFRSELQRGKRQNALTAGVLKGGISIAGCALQFAAWGGAKRIVLCGVEMQGNEHFDGTANANMDARAVWGVCWKMNHLIESLRQFQGIETVSLNPTAVKVPVVEH